MKVYQARAVKEIAKKVRIRLKHRHESNRNCIFAPFPAQASIFHFRCFIVFYCSTYTGQPHLGPVPRYHTVEIVVILSNRKLIGIKQVGLNCELSKCLFKTIKSKQ